MLEVELSVETKEGQFSICLEDYISYDYQAGSLTKEQAIWLRDQLQDFIDGLPVVCTTIKVFQSGR